MGHNAAKVTMSSTKSATGHLLGAAGAIEAIFSILAIRDQVAPPTINLDNPAVETPVDLAPNTKREREIKVALSNSFGFGIKSIAASSAVDWSFGSLGKAAILY